jgi:hypothetical protein
MYLFAVIKCRCDEMPAPKPPESFTLDPHSESEEASPEHTDTNTNADLDFLTCDTSGPDPNTQAELHDLARDFNLPKTKIHLLGSRIQTMEYS